MSNFRTKATSACAVGCVVIAALMLVLSVGCGGDEQAQDSTTPREPDLSASPAGVRWLDYQGVQLPVGADGPSEVTAMSATGFTQTPQGAALAAIVHTIRMSLAPDEHWADIAKHELAMGPGRDSWVTSRGLLSIETSADPAQAPRVRGYTITDYTPISARVDIFTSFPDQSIAINSTVVVWIGGDWWLQLPPPDSIEPVVRAVDSVSAVVKLEAPQ
ncbi:hypothetical protein ACIHDR_46010 [Nocardia sp. NPDC052278]|uniref:hypothetical protein n=1 Tax=unclassified Nocardia TaxID=2637762 RepID=UPI0036827851